MKKKWLTIISTIVSIGVLSINVSATSESILISSETVGNTIEANIFKGDISYYDFLFGVSNVDIMYEYAIPYYTYNFTENYEKLSDVYSFSGNYFIPVKSLTNEFIGFAEYAQTTDGEWEIISTAAGDYYTGFFDAILTNSIYSGYSSAFLGGDEVFNDLGIIFNDNTDMYFDYSAYFINNNTSTRTISSYADYFVPGNTKLLEITSKVAINADSEGNSGTDWDFPGEEEVVFSEKEDLDPSEFEVEIPIEEPEETANAVQVERDPNETDGGTVEVENPKTGSHSVLPTIIAAGILGTTAFLINKKK